MKSRASLPVGVPRLPDPSGVDVTDANAMRGFLASLTSALVTHLAQRPAIGTAQDSRIFRSPDGKHWAVSVADDGTVTADPLGSTQVLPVPPI